MAWQGPFEKHRRAGAEAEVARVLMATTNNQSINAPIVTHDGAALADGTEVSAKRPRRKSSLLANLLLVIVSGLVTLIALEGVVRLIPTLQVQTGDGEYLFCAPIQVRHQPHTRFGYTEVPGNSYFERFSALDPWTYVRINGEGFRDNNNHGAPVIVLGDSMTRGTLVNEDESYTDVLHRWHPDTSFRNYGIGGFGQAHAIRIYDSVGQRLPHKLVIAQFSLSTDIDDNVESAVMSGAGARITIEPAVGSPRQSENWLVRTHLFLWSHSKLYPLLYNSAGRPFFGNWDARRNVPHALELTRRLLVQLEEKAKQNDADLLVLVWPAWAEMAGRDDGMHPERQREMLRRFATDNPGVFLLDLTPVLKREDPNQTYGVIDKHLTPYGHFLVAKSLDHWMTQEWPKGARMKAPERRFEPLSAVTPRCDRAEAYLERVKFPEQRGGI